MQPGQSGPSRNYEFNDAENQELGRSALWARVLGGLLIGQGVIGLKDIQENPAGGVIGLALAIAIGVAFIQGGNAMSRVVTTQGTDVIHLMEALRSLTLAFTIRIVLMIIALVLLVLGILLIGCLGAAMSA